MSTPKDAVFRRLTPHAAEDIDALVAPHDRRVRGAGRVLFPDALPLPPLPGFRDPEAVFVGFRVYGPRAPAEQVSTALRLAAFAAEQDAGVIVLTDQDGCGLERFGFRCERVAGDTAEARAACEAQIRAFWGLDLLL